MNHQSPHQGDNRSGHWWQPGNDDAPQWFFDQFVRDWTRSDSPSHSGAPDLPDDLDWTDYRSYNCRVCNDDCINRRDSEASENDECWACVNLPELK